MIKPLFVFGDAVLDHDVFLDSTGFVPTGNTLALRARQVTEKFSLGGAGRVAAIAAKNSDRNLVHLFAPTGFDQISGRYQTVATACKVNLQPHPRTDRSVSVKLRYWTQERTAAPTQLLLHVDQDVHFKWQTMDSACLDTFDPPEGHVFVIVDHGKGCCSPEMKSSVMRMAHNYNQIVLVDPGRDDDLMPYMGDLTIYKFNAQQAQRLAATKLPTPKIFDWEERQPEEVYYELLDRVAQAMNRIDHLGIWLTLGPGGMLYMTDEGHTIRVKSQLDFGHAVDTCGAGDTAMAAMADGLTREIIRNKTQIEQVLIGANYAAQQACTVARWNR